jgi:hypothetical protein
VIYEEMPKHISRKFFNYPAKVPDEFRSVFMPRVGAKYSMTEIERWLKSSQIEFERRSVYLFFKDEVQATMFKLFWC